MRKSLFALVFFLYAAQLLTAQVSHLSLVYDFEGEDFDYSVRGMYGANDSLYVLSYTPDHKGMFFRIDENGNGFHLIWKFDGEDYEPFSLLGNDTAIYVTTHQSPAVFKYSLNDYSFKRVKRFDHTVGSAIVIKRVTENTLWFTSQGSSEDITSIFTSDLNGNDVTKIYGATSEQNSEKGWMISDLFFHDDKMYVSFWGGGELDLSSTYCGSFVRMNPDGSEYETILPGSEQVGTQPQSILIRDNKMFGLFAYGGSLAGARFFISNLDGTEYDSLGEIPDRALTRMLDTDSLIYVFAGMSIVGINPVTREVRVSEDLLSNPDFGADVVSDPAYLNGQVYLAAQQGGPNGGGTILKWTNEPPEVNIPETAGGKLSGNSIDIDLNTLFTDANGDQITHQFRYNSNLLDVSEENGILTLTPNVSDSVEIFIIARDGWTGYNGARITLNPFSITAVNPKLITGTPEGPGEKKPGFFVYPNPATRELKFSTRLEWVDIIGVDGKVHASYTHPGESIDISTLRTGMYFVRAFGGGRSYIQKLIKR